MFSEQLTSLNRRLRILWLGLRGQIQFQRGIRSQELDQAKSTFDELAALDGDSFLAHLNLGRIADLRQQSSLALIHLTLAFQIDAERFHRSPIGARLKRRIATRQGLIRAGSPRTPMRESIEDELQQMEALALRRSRVLPLGDFISLDEQESFRDRPAISREEIANTDLNALLRQLLS